MHMLSPRREPAYYDMIIIKGRSFITRGNKEMLMRIFKAVTALLVDAALKVLRNLI